MALLRSRVLRAFLTAIAIVTPSYGLAQSLPERADEYRVKAAILYNLAKFVEWPAEAFADAGAPLVVCVAGTDPFGPVLDEALSGRLVGKRPVAARRVKDVSPGCHVLFIAGSERKRLPVILERLKDSSVLTVSEADDFTRAGGMIGLTTEGDRVRFDINAEAADRAHLKVSARLMALAAGRRTEGPSK